MTRGGGWSLQPCCYRVTVLIPATGGFDPMPLRTPQKVGGHLRSRRILQIGQKINDFFGDS